MNVLNMNLSWLPHRPPGLLCLSIFSHQSYYFSFLDVFKFEETRIYVVYSSSRVLDLCTI